MTLLGQNFPAFDSAAPWIVTVVAVIGWAITAWVHVGKISNLKAERDKLKADAIDAAGATLERKQAARTAYRDACRNVSIASREVVDFLRNDAPGLREARDNLCRIISDDVLHAFHNYCEWEKLELTHDPGGMEQFVARVLCPELDRIAKWVTICNHDRLVKEHKLNPLKISDQTLYVYSQLCSNMHDDGKRSTASAGVNAAIDRLLRV